MRVGFDISDLKDTKWYELAVRFLFGGAITAVTGILANRYGPVFGGLFLAFPALFPASATLLEKHEREKKSWNRKYGSRVGGCRSGCARRSDRKHRPRWFRTYSMEIGAHVERRDCAFRSARGVDHDFSSDLHLRGHRLFLRKSHTGAASHAPVSSKDD